jgi:hypothetical protein
MLADLGTVLDGHVPATEIDNTRAQLTVKLEQRGLSSHGSSGLAKKA